MKNLNDSVKTEKMVYREVFTTREYVDQVFGNIKSAEFEEDRLLDGNRTKEEKKKAEEKMNKRVDAIETAKETSVRNLNRYFRLLLKTLDVDIGDKRKPFKISGELQEQLEECVAYGGFNTARDMEQYRKEVKNMPDILENQDWTTQTWISHQKEIVKANTDVEEYKNLKNKYNDKLDELAELYDRIAKEAARNSQVLRENMLTCCSFNLFNQKERNAYFAKILRIIEEYDYQTDGVFTGEDIIIIEFLRLGKELDRAIERARADLFIASHMQER